MTILKTVDGQEIDTEKFQGFGTFKKYVQENIDPEFGTGSNKRKTTYEIELSATKTVDMSLILTIEANTKKEAEKKAIEEAKRNVYRSDWQEGLHDEITDIQIENVTISEDDEQ